MKKTMRVQISLTVLALTSAATIMAAPPTGKTTNGIISRPALGKQTVNIGTFAEAKQLIGADLKDSQNKLIGKVDDVVVDLESGQILYLIGSQIGSNDHFAIAPPALMPQVTGKSVKLNGDQAKLAGAPKIDINQTNNLGNGSFVGQVFQAYGVPSQFDANGSFNNVHKASQLYALTVKDVANADFGKIDEVILDLHAARVPFVVLTRNNSSYAIPPNAFTLAADKSTLVTGLDQKTMASAPRYTKGQTQMLANRTTAAAIYNHYGKQPYFNAAGTLTPTSR